MDLQKTSYSMLGLATLVTLALASVGTARASEVETVPIAALNPRSDRYLPETEDRLQEFDRITATDAPVAEIAIDPEYSPEPAPVIVPVLEPEVPVLEPEVPVLEPEPPTVAPTRARPTWRNRRNRRAQRRRRSQPNATPEGLYGALSADWRILRTVQLQGLKIASVGTIGSGDADSFSGLGLNAAAGYKFPENNFRVEAQLSYGRNAIGNITLPAVASRNLPREVAGANGSISTLSGMLNLYYDINTASKWQPYVGGGIGLTKLSANDVRATYSGTSLTTVVDNDKWGFAYQLMAGMAYYITPRTAVTAGYRYFDPVGGNAIDTPLGEVRLDDNGTHNFEFGVRYFF